MANDSFYKSMDWIKIRSKALKRDNYTCRFCSLPIKGKGLAYVDHIKPRKLYPALSFELSNLQSLCGTCHNKTKQIIEINAHKPAINMNGLPDSWN